LDQISAVDSNSDCTPGIIQVSIQDTAELINFIIALMLEPFHESGEGTVATIDWHLT
jgi:hypothetical protein